MDLDNGEILSATYTDSKTVDSKCFEELIEKAEKTCNKPIATVRADKAYDNRPCYKAMHKRGIKSIIPTRKDAVTQNELKKSTKGEKQLKCLEERDKIIEYVNKHDNYEIGIKAWKISEKYHLRSRIESCMNRVKRTFGGMLRSKCEESRKNEVMIKLGILNMINTL